MKEKLDKLNFTKTKNFCFVKDTVKRMKSKAIKKVFVKYLSDKDWHSKYIKNSLSKKKANKLILKWSKALSRLVTKDINMVNKQMK